jgi:gluconokinase
MILALDVGTSSTRVAAYDHAGRPVPGRFHQVAHPPMTTPDGGVEHDPARLLDAVVTCLDAVLVGARVGEVEGVAVATFWHGLLGFDAAGRPLTPLYTWADTRSAGEAALLHDALDDAAVHARTGCHLHASYWPAKLRWLVRERPDDVRRAARWGSVGEHLELTLFGEAATSVSMASATGLFDQDRLEWDRETLAAADLEETRLFPLCERTEPRHGLRPRWATRWPVLRGVPWFPAVGDGAASNVGSGCTDPSRVALNVGTSAALRVVTEAGDRPSPGLWRYRLDRRTAVVGAALSEGGNVYAWCREVLRLPEDSALEALLARATPDAHGLTVLPFLAGERSPGWRADRRGVIAGLGLETTAVEIAAAAMEAVAVRVALAYGLLRPFAAPDHVVVASGGALARSRAWTRMIVDALGRPVQVARVEEATSRGAALLALEALRILPGLGAALPPPSETVLPDAARHARYAGVLARQRALDRAAGGGRAPQPTFDGMI